jgi:hypothetical protein
MNDKWFLVCILAFLVLGIYWSFRYFSISSNASYAIASTTKSYIAKGVRKQTDYYFFVNGVKTKGSYTELVKSAKEIVVPNGKYLVVYSTSNPNVSILLIDKPITDTINIDSLNELGVDKNDIDWTKL